MNTLKRLGIALWRTLLDQGDLIAMQVLLPPVAGAISKHVRLAVTGTHIPHEGPSRLVSYRQAVTRTMDGAVLDGEAPGTWAKYAIPKGLPAEEGERRMAIENQAHSVEECSFVIKEGYGKGTKTLVYAGTATYKIDGESHFGRVAVHFHEADKAGPHYDLVCEGVPTGTERWELAIHSGQCKGRYAFVDASGAMSSVDNEGRLIARMKDRGVRLEKPNYRLKDRAWLESEVRANPGRYNVTRKYDGALVNGAGREGRLYLHSHREGGETYYDRFPQIEYLANDSRLLSCRLLFPRADFEFLIQGEIVHRDGAARAGGLCNSHPEKAVAYQQEHGEADLYVWDCLSYHGKDLSPLPHRERHVYAARLVEELRPYSNRIHLAEEMPASGDPAVFYDRVVSDRRGLPYSEGIVVEDNNDPTGAGWFKVKQSDLADFELVQVLPGAGGKFTTSAGALVVRDPISGTHSRVGSFKVNDQTRQYIFDHRAELEGSVVRIEAMEKTTDGAAPRRPVRRFPSRQEPGQRRHHCHTDGLTGNREARSLGLLLTRVARPQFGRPGQSNLHRKSPGKSQKDVL
jgi:hypothetical protein